MHRKTKYAGKRFGMLVAVSRSDVKCGETYNWVFRCDCENTVVRSIQSVKRSVSNGFLSCGCTKTLHTKNPLYSIWRGMLRRCYNLNTPHYDTYGGRGIKVCERWKNSLENFIKDMGEGYRKGLQIDRIDNDGDYAPDNCKWSTPSEQMRNMGKNFKVDFIEYGVVTIAEAAERSGISYSTLYYRVKSGWPREDWLNKGYERYHYNTKE